jgi:rRNA small subunit pseudouridine methyltransferase Nep1
MGKKRKAVEDGEQDLPKNRQSSNFAKKSEKRLIVILEGAHLETCKSHKDFELLNIDEHRGILNKAGRDFSTARPDITHQCLLMLFDSPLNRAGLLQVYIRTANNVLIEINPSTRIPRTFKRFAGLMVQLLHKYSITAAESTVKLLKVIKNPVTDHLPPGCRKVLMSFSADKKPVKPSTLVPEGEEPICIVVGAIAKGAIVTDYTEENISISNYPLSAALTCTKLCDAFENAWGIF